MISKHTESQTIFKCQKCGECCDGYGGTYINATDIEKISHFLNLPSATFIATYCTPSGKALLLTQKASGKCIFWDKICTIHPVKPKMCRTWPFIPSVVKFPDNWEIMASMCPGMQTGLSPDFIREVVLREMTRTHNPTQ